jgi:hypothetical protein
MTAVLANAATDEEINAVFQSAMIAALGRELCDSEDCYLLPSGKYSIDALVLDASWRPAEDITRVVFGHDRMDQFFADVDPVEGIDQDAICRQFLFD